MGHSRLNTLPDTEPWRKVVRRILEGSDAAVVADQTREAAQKALLTVQNDAGFREAVHLLVQLAEAGKKSDLASHLSAVGVDLGDGNSVADVTVALAEAVGRRMEGNGMRSDWGEMARGALVGAVSEYLAPTQEKLFSGTRDDLVAELRPLHTEKGFGALGQKFFGTLVGKCLDYFLSKSLGSKVGEGQPFATTSQVSAFQGALKTHCDEVSLVVRDYCGEWLSLHRYEEKGNISRESAEKFGWYALEKIRLTLAERARRGGN
jgi:hypothetical protein